MFAGEGDPYRTNRRFHLLSQGSKATRLSTAFDSVTLYGRDPHLRPDIYGKVGTSGVSVATLDNMKVLYDGFDLCESIHVCVHDDQRSGAGHPGDVPQHRYRPATRTFRAARGPGAHTTRKRRGPRTHLAIRARHCAPTSSKKMARTRACSPPSSRCAAWPTCSSGSSSIRCAISTRSPSPAITSLRRGRTPSRNWPSRWPMRSPMSRRTSPAGWPSTTSPRTCPSSSPTEWTRNTPSSAASPVGSGPSRCASATGPTADRRS